jgi:hypothetical protein
VCRELKNVEKLRARLFIVASTEFWHGGVGHNLRSSRALIPFAHWLLSVHTERVILKNFFSFDEVDHLACLWTFGKTHLDELYTSQRVADLYSCLEHNSNPDSSFGAIQYRTPYAEQPVLSAYRHTNICFVNQLTTCFGPDRPSSGDSWRIHIYCNVDGQSVSRQRPVNNLQSR